MSIRSYLWARGVDYDSLSSNTKFYAWVGDLVDRGKITIEHFHEYFGKLNGIPDCCVQYFIRNESKDYNLHLKAVKNGQPANIGYVMCPKCIKEHLDRTP